MVQRKQEILAPLVHTFTVRVGPHPVRILAEGTVKPLQEIELVPQVGGKVVAMSPNLINGGSFDKGDVLLEIDPVDYELAVTLADARVKDAISAVKLLEEEAEAAEEEWHLLRKQDQKERQPPPSLVVKGPQLEAARARLAADKANLERARLDLERTRLKAPFDGRVSQENVDTGQYVRAGQTVATLYSIDAAEVVIPLQDRDLYWFHVPGITAGKGPGATARVTAQFAGQELSWDGRVVRAEGKLDERTRMIRVVVRVEKPYASKPPMKPGLFVNVDIQGRTVQEGALIPRSCLRPGNVVWVVDQENRLFFRTVEVVRTQGHKALIQSGLSDGERVVLSHLQAVTDGMAVRVVSGEGDE